MIYILPANIFDFIIYGCILIGGTVIRPYGPKIIRLVWIHDGDKAYALIAEFYPKVNLFFSTITGISVKGQAVSLQISDKIQSCLFHFAV